MRQAQQEWSGFRTFVRTADAAQAGLEGSAPSCDFAIDGRFSFAHGCDPPVGTCYELLVHHDGNNALLTEVSVKDYLVLLFLKARHRRLPQHGSRSRYGRMVR